MTHKVSFHRLARKDLFDLYDYVEGQSGTKTAGDYLERIEALCGRLSALPERGKDRSDLGAGIRTVALERRVLVVYRTAANEVEILRVLYAGRDFTADDVSE